MKKIIFIILLAKNFSLFSLETLLYFHIPKTGGTTITYLLEKNYSVSEITGKDPLFTTTYANTHSLQKVWQNPKRYKLITILRHPVNRVLSDHRFCMEKHKGNPVVLKSHFYKPLENPIEHANNIACRLLSGLNPLDITIPIEVHLKVAKENLLNLFFFVGILEKFEESLKLLFFKLNLPAPNELPYHNATYSSNSFYSNEVLDGIARRNWADIELYEFAVDLFDERAKIPPIKSESIYRDPTPHIGNAKQLIYNFDMPLDGGGWCLRDYFKDGHSYRWISSENRASIFFDLNPVSYFLEFRMLMPHSFISNFRLAVNGSAVPFEFKSKPLESIKDEFIWVNFKAHIPSTLIKPHCNTELSFELLEPEDPELREAFLKITPDALPSRNFERGKCALSYLCFTEE